MSDQSIESLLQMELSTPGNVWNPTPHGIFMAEVLAANNFVNGKSVLELGAGAANHTVVMLRQGAARLVATEIHEDFLATTRHNVERNFPGAQNVEYRVADWLNTEGTFEVLVTNPPFCKSGKQNRRYYIDSLILDGHKRLEPGGTLLFVQSSMADLSMTMRRLDANGFEAKIVDRRRGLFRDYYFEDAEFMREIKEVAHGFELDGGKHYETLFVIAATLRPWSPGDGAHVTTDS